MTTVGELCNRTVWIAHAHESVLDAAHRMREQHVGCLVVVEERDAGRVPVGVITDRDVVVRGVAEKPAELERRTVGELMTRRVVHAHEGEPVVDALSRMRAFGVRRMPVVSADEVLQGIVAVDDLLEHVADQLGAIAQLLRREQRRERS